MTRKRDIISLTLNKLRFCLLLRFFIALFLFYIIFSFFNRNNLVPVILIPGGGLTNDGTIPIHTKLRLIKAHDLYLRFFDRNPIIVTLSGGTTHKPNPLDKYGFPITEATAAAKELIAMGISPFSIREENFSLDTIGNAFYSKYLHVDPMRYENLHVITNIWHMERTQEIFKFVFYLPSNSYCTYICSTLHNTINYIFGYELLHFIKYYKYNLHFHSVENGIIDSNILEARIKREKQSLKQFLRTKTLLHNSVDLFKWIYNDHNAYSSKRLQNYTMETIEPEVLKTY